MAILKNKIVLWLWQYKILWALCVFLIWFYFCLPQPLFNKPYATVIYGENNELIGAKIASDEQWRFPLSDSIPYKFKQCIIYFEDEYFYYHPGVNPFALVKAFYANLKSKRTVRGGSTITMQTIRMVLNNPPRTYIQKLKEIIYALRLELGYSKNEILIEYCAHAPFGGNVVGLEAASWRYYGRPPHQLSWGETATLAVLPNAPALIYPGKNQTILLNKRNRLLKKLYQNQVIDSITFVLAKNEPLPQRPVPLPQNCYHLTQQIADTAAGKKIITTINHTLQKQTNNIVNRYYNLLKTNNINNIAVLITETNSGYIKAYIGNTQPTQNEQKHGNDIDMITTPRSTGSILKPLLYALAMDEGIILPKSLIKDIPTTIAGFHPKNFDKTYRGAVPADVALAQSLNIPAVRLLRTYGLQKFRDKLQQLNLKSINKEADHYGLTLILGGAEISLYEAVVLYSSMGRRLNFHYDKNAYFPLRVSTVKSPLKSSTAQPKRIIGVENIWAVFNALSEKDRPVEGGDWSIYQSSQKIAWKTGTSYGHRDAWCIGVTPKYTVGVWVGNTTNEGRTGLTGTQVAAPIMFDIFKLLPASAWFEKPKTELINANTCKESGYLASQNCVNIISSDIPKNGVKSKPCPYHKIIHLDSTKQYQVNSSCYEIKYMVTEKRFILPPIMAYYYKKSHPYYQYLPSFNPNCTSNQKNVIGIIYPEENSKIFIPKDFHDYQKIVFKASYSEIGAPLYWFIDDEFKSVTTSNHQLDIRLLQGKHTLTITDKLGNTCSRHFEIL